MELSKAETAKALFKHLGYLFTGLSLIVGMLTLLGPIMDALIQVYGEATMPVVISFVPLLIFLTAIGWGAYFIWKGISAIDIAFGIICELADRIILNRMSRRARVLVGTLPMLAGVVILIIAIIQTAFRAGLFNADPVITISNIATPLWVIGFGLLIFGLVVTHDIKGRQMEQARGATQN